VRSAGWLAAAAILAVAAVASPLDRLADVSFSWHMVQHMMLLYGVALAVVLARPFDLFVRLGGKRATLLMVRLTRPLHAFASPAVALFVFVATLWATHFSPLYEAALEHPWLHGSEHLLYVSAGIFFWLPVVAPPPLRPTAFPVRLFYLAVALPQGALLAMVLASARAPLYQHYVAVAGAAALADQRNAAAVMWILGGLVVFTALLTTLAIWAHRESETSRVALQSSRVTLSPSTSLRTSSVEGRHGRVGPA
jgi:putative membrane protein